MRTLTVLVFLFFVSVSAWNQVTISSANQEGCTPMGVTIDVDSPDPATIASYDWEITTPSGAVITASSATYTGIFSETGSYDVSLTIDNGDNVTELDFITVHDVPTAEFEVSDVLGCYPLCVDFTDLSVVADGDIVEWVWDFGNGETSSLEAPTLCYQNAGTYTPLLSIEDEFGCFSDISYPGLIEVLDQFPTPQFTASSYLDCNAPVAISFENTSSGFSDLTSSWDFGDSNTQDTPDISTVSNVFNGVGVYEVCLTVEDEIGCAAQTCSEIDIFDSADAEYSYNLSQICAGQLVSFTNETALTPVSVQWDINGDGVINTTNPNPNFTFTEPGVYSPAFTVIYSDNCQNTQVIPDAIEVFDEMTVSFDYDNDGGCSVPLSVNFTNNTVGSGNITYEWLVDSVVVSNDIDYTHEFTEFGTYDIELIASSDVGCTVSYFQENIINLNQPQVSFVNNQTMCMDDEVQIQDVVLSSSETIDQLNWDFDDDGTTDITGPSPVFSYALAGDYVINLEVVTESGCTASFEGDTITVFEPIVPQWTISEEDVCAEIIVEFCVDGLTEEISALWNTGDTDSYSGVNFAAPCFNYHYADTGDFDVSLSIFNAGCSFDTIIENAITIHGPIAAFEASVNCANSLTVTMNDNSIEADSLYWDFGDGSDFVYNELNPVHTYDDMGLYEVTLYTFNDSIGCEDFTAGEVLLAFVDPSIDFAPTSGCPPLEVDFMNINTYPIWNVDFGNGSTFSAVLNDDESAYMATLNEPGSSFDFVIDTSATDILPLITYTEVGQYDVTVTASDIYGCSETIVYEDAVEVSSSSDFASFDVVPVSECDELIWSFVPDSANLQNIEWTFSTGIISVEETPEITFSNPLDSSIVVSLYAEDIDGCISTVEEEFEILPPSQALFSIEQPANCINDEFIVLNESVGDIISYAWDFGDPASGADNTSDLENPSHFYQQNGIYDVCLTIETADGCISEHCIINAVQINNPEPSFTYNPDVNNCLWGVQFNNTTPGVIDCSDWDFGDDQFGTGQSPYHTYPIGVYDVQLIVCNDYGCTDSIMINDILNYGNVIGPFTQDIDDTPCAPYTVEFESFNTLDISFDYFWDFDDGNGDPNGNTTTVHDYVLPGGYCPSLIMTDPSGCAVLIECPDSIYVEEFTLNTSDISDLCLGDTLLFEVSGGETYVWDDMTFVTEIDPESFYIHPNTTSDFSLFSTLSDCETTYDFTVTVNELPVVTLDDMPDVCQFDDDFEFNAGMPNDIPGIYYVNGVIETDFSPSWDANMNYQVEYFYTDANNCFASAFDDIFINPLPEVVLSPFPNMCQNDGILTLNNGDPIGGEFLVNDIVTVDFNPDTNIGINSVIYNFTDNNGCFNSDTQDLLVSPIPQIQFELGPPCENESIIVNNLSTIHTGSIDSAYWDFGIAGNSTEFDPLPFSISTSGNYDISLELFSDMGCSDQMTYDFQIFENPESLFELQDVCQFDNLLIADESSSVEGEIDSWNWFIDDELVILDQNFDLSMENWGQYNITLVVESEFGCVDSLIQPVDVFPVPEIGIAVDDNCLEEETVFLNQTNIPETAIDSYEWNLGDGTITDQINAIEHQYILPGTYWVSLEAWTQTGCSAIDSVPVTVHPLPTVDFDNSDDVLCQFGSVEFFGLSDIADPYNIASVYWSVNGEVVSDEMDFTQNFEGSGLYDVAFTAVTNTGCTSTLSEEDVIMVNPTPVADFHFANEQLNITDPLVEIVDDSFGAVYYEYNFGDGSYSDEVEPTHIYSDYIQYTVTQIVSNEFGCADTTQKGIFVDQDIVVYIPNAFSPDQDGLNDVFIPVVSGFDVEFYEFMIFNRWGEKIFETNQLDEGWTGDVYNGEYFSPDGIYEYQVRVRARDKAEIHKFRGSVSILR